MINASLSQWLQYLETLHPNEIDLGLQRITEVAQNLQLLPIKQPVVTVAGTNGKGSTVAVLEALLKASGKRSAAFTSPHLLYFNERIRIDGIEADDAAIVTAFEQIEAARGTISLTYFEFAALAALLVFLGQGRQPEPDVILLEVGLGGRLDAVNIVDASVAVITSIDLDHQSWLGTTRAQIALEKAGVARPNTPVVIADPQPPEALRDFLKELGAAPTLYIGESFTLEIEAGEWRADFHTGGPDSKTQIESGLSLGPLKAGSVLPENICAAVQAFLLLGLELSPAEMTAAISTVSPPARRETFSLAGVSYIVDVAHNPAAVGKLLEYMHSSCCNGRHIAIFSLMSDKDAQKIVRVAAGGFDSWFVADQPSNPRAASAADLEQVLRSAGEQEVSTCVNLYEAYRQAHSSAKPGDTVVIFGSFTTVAELLPILQGAAIESGAIDLNVKKADRGRAGE